ncbi:hypothetical protein IFR05_008473 [Cadophora sp. M221]|nr:hypothetical protein IFR05_008473 [Cadophora sp. M221]
MNNQLAHTRQQRNCTQDNLLFKMANVWKFKTSPSPPLVSYIDIAGRNHPDGQDTWITAENLKVLKHIPGVPEAYAGEESASLVLYVRGVPFGITSAAFREMFMPFGKVNKSPVLICLGSQETFRWVIMKHADDAQDVKRALHGSTHESGSQLYISMAMKPGEVFELRGKVLPSGHQTSKEYTGHQNGLNGHGHPARLPPQPSKSLLPAIPRVAIPTIVLPDAQGGPVIAPPPGLGVRTAEQQTVSSPSHEEQVAHPVEKPAEPRQHSSISSASSGESTVKARSVAAAAEQVCAQPSSWANIASSSDPDTRIIELRPEHKSSNVGPRLIPVGRIPKVVSTREEPLTEQMRLVFLLNLPNTIGLQEITQAIQEGPLVRIQFGVDTDNQARFVGIIFQHAIHAEAFQNVLIKERERSRPERFRFIVDVVRGDAVPADHIIRSMNDHPFATRRLTIVKGKFFFMFGERQLKDLCCKIAGDDNVQLVWLYNGGNATVVFADVESAIKVKRVLDKKAKATTDGVVGAESIVWKGLQTTFSKDPCIHPLDLKTAMHD